MKQLIILGLVLTIVGCATQTQNRTTIALPGEDPNKTVLPDKATSDAVLSLLEQARQATREGNYPKAEVLLERTVRIEPRNASLWHYLAKLRLYQGRHSEAMGLAAKSNNLAKSNRRLKADNWRLIAHAKHQLGDVAGAKQAQEKANKISR